MRRDGAAPRREHSQGPCEATTGRTPHPPARLPKGHRGMTACAEDSAGHRLPVVCVPGLSVKERWASPLWSGSALPVSGTLPEDRKGCEEPPPCPCPERIHMQEAFPDPHDQSQWLRIPCHMQAAYPDTRPAMKMPRHRLHPAPPRAYVLSVAGGSGVQAGPVPTRAASVALSEYAKMFAESCAHTHSVCSIRHGCEVREVLCPCGVCRKTRSVAGLQPASSRAQRLS